MSLKLLDKRSAMTMWIFARHFIWNKCSRSPKLEESGATSKFVIRVTATVYPKLFFIIELDILIDPVFLTLGRNILYIREN
jgi:hypothetical protein